MVWQLFRLLGKVFEQAMACSVCKMERTSALGEMLCCIMTVLQMSMWRMFFTVTEQVMFTVSGQHSKP